MNAPPPSPIGLLLAVALAASLSGGGGLAQETGAPASPERRVIEIRPNDQVPTVAAIAPIDGTNVLFLNHRGQIGMAKFSPGLSQIGWQLYSEVKLNGLPSLALGPNYSVLAASPTELTQAFDTSQNLELDFFQAVVRDWPGREAGVVVTAGPVADPHGRVLFALSPHSLGENAAPKARLMAWLPQDDEILPVTESELPIESFAVSRSGLLAARLSLPDYADGFFLSLTELPAPAPKPAADPGSADAPDAPAPAPTPPAPIPSTLPSLILPAELSKGEAPVNPAFFRESGRDKLLLACPGSRHLVEVVPDPGDGLWQGAVLLRGVSAKPVRAVVEMGRAGLLGGGDEGFLPLEDDPSIYRIVRLERVSGGILVGFSQPVDRFEAVKPESFSVKAIALGGGETTLAVEPLVESDGKTVFLRSQSVGGGHVLRVVCQNLPSEKGEALLSPSAFYTVHAP